MNNCQLLIPFCLVAELKPKVKRQQVEASAFLPFHLVAELKHMVALKQVEASAILTYSIST